MALPVAVGRRRSPRPERLPLRRSRLARTPTGGWRLELPRRLDSPNRWLYASWRAKAAEKQAWAAAIVACLVDNLGPQALEVLPPASVPGARGATCQRRCRVTITRVVRASHFIRDVDNLAFAPKLLVDALQDLGFLRDDDQVWTERPLPAQVVAPDGVPWTIVEIEPL